MSSKRSPLCTFVLLSILSISSLAQADQPQAVTITRKAPLQTLSPEGTMTGVQEAAVGTKYTWVSTDGANIVVADSAGAHYKVATAATDYVPRRRRPAPAATPAVTASTAPAASSPDASAPASSTPIAGQASNDTAPDFGPQRHRL